MRGGNYANPPWTEAELKPLRDALADPKRPSIRELSRRLSVQLGRSENAVETRLFFILNGGRPTRAGLDSKPGTARPAFRSQRCLKCREVHRLPAGIFVCDGCKKTPEWRAAYA